MSNRYLVVPEARRVGSGKRSVEHYRCLSVGCFRKCLAQQLKTFEGWHPVSVSVPQHAGCVRQSHAPALCLDAGVCIRSLQCTNEMLPSQMDACTRKRRCCLCLVPNPCQAQGRGSGTWYANELMPAFMLLRPEDGITLPARGIEIELPESRSS